MYAEWIVVMFFAENIQRFISKANCKGKGHKIKEIMLTPGQHFCHNFGYEFVEGMVLNTVD